MNVEVDSSAKCLAIDEIVINANIEKVFGILSDINSWPQWQSNVKNAVLTGEIVTGNEFRWQAGGLKIRSRLHTVNPYHEIGWTGIILWIAAVHNWHLSEENGKTHVLVKESLKGFGSPILRQTLKEGMTRNLNELKVKAETV